MSQLLAGLNGAHGATAAAPSQLACAVAGATTLLAGLRGAQTPPWPKAKGPDRPLGGDKQSM